VHDVYAHSTKQQQATAGKAALAPPLARRIAPSRASTPPSALTSASKKAPSGR
jgi:hypothetical protein